MWLTASRGIGNHLRCHASGHKVVEKVCDAVDNLGQHGKAVVNHRENIAKASQYLQAVIDSNKPVVAWI